MRRSLGRKYVAALSPGYRLAPGLGGNTRHLPREQVNAWRQAYLLARHQAGLAGFAEFNFRVENSTRVVMRDVLTAHARVA